MEKLIIAKNYLAEFFGNIWHLIQHSLVGVSGIYTKLIKALLLAVPNMPMIGKNFKRKESASLHALEMEYQTDCMIVIISLLSMIALAAFGNSSYRGLIAPLVMGLYCSLVTQQEIIALEGKNMKRR